MVLHTHTKVEIKRMTKGLHWKLVDILGQYMECEKNTGTFKKRITHQASTAEKSTQTEGISCSVDKITRVISTQTQKEGNILKIEKILKEKEGYEEISSVLEDDWPEEVLDTIVAKRQV